MSLVPVTILTGFLGSGKTTLLNRILKEQHGQRIAVIENEFGEAGIDNELLVQETGEQIVEMNNGCICCTVRGDLVRILGELYARPFGTVCSASSGRSGRTCERAILSGLQVGDAAGRAGHADPVHRWSG